MLLIQVSPLNWAGCLPWEQTVGSTTFTLPDARRGSGRRDGALYPRVFVDVLSEDYMRTARAKGVSEPGLSSNTGYATR